LNEASESSLEQEKKLAAQDTVNNSRTDDNTTTTNTTQNHHATTSKKYDYMLTLFYIVLALLITLLWFTKTVFLKLFLWLPLRLKVVVGILNQGDMRSTAEVVLKYNGTMLLKRAWGV
jgi:hypothetical protein